MGLSGLRWRLLLLVPLLNAGCRERGHVVFVSSPQVLALPAEAQASLQSEMRERVGTFEQPRSLLPPVAAKASPRDVPARLHPSLRHGQEVYQLRCAQCHGATGDGNGPAAAAMYPRPRDYRRGIFKFTSTPYGAKPVRSDLVRTVKYGVRGTSMPDFKLLPDDEIDAVVEYVLYLAQRGELEEQLAALADFEGKVTKELVDEEEIIPTVIDRWKEANGQQIVPFTSQPLFTEDHVRRGKEAFLTKGCSKCHGDDGRGQTPDNLAGNLKDVWGNMTRAADLTSGMLHGGPRPADVYRRIYSGINGTPMPGFATSLQSEPDTIWDLVAYVLYVSGRRRAGDRFPPGTIAPYVPAGAETAQKSES